MVHVYTCTLPVTIEQKRQLETILKGGVYIIRICTYYGYVQPSLPATYIRILLHIRLYVLVYYNALFIRSHVELYVFTVQGFS